MRNNVILACFAGSGKSYAAKIWKDSGQINDLESSQYQWIYPEGTDLSDVEALKGISDKIRNPMWPLNYIYAIKESWQNNRVTLISMQKEIRDILDYEAVDYILIYPSYDQKEIYIERYRERGNQENFIKLLETNWENWLDDLMDDENPKTVISAGENVSDVIELCNYLGNENNN